MKIYQINQNSEEWFELRKGKFTASDAQAIATNGKGLETLVYKKVSERLARGTEPPYTNLDMERGHELEEMARVGYELETGNTVTVVGFCELDENTGASPDGMVDPEGLVEIKCKIGPIFVKEMLTASVDSEHEWQMQMQMWVTDRQWCDYVVFNPNFSRNLIIKRVMRNEDKITKIKAGVESGKTMISSILEKINK